MTFFGFQPSTDAKKKKKKGKVSLVWAWFQHTFQLGEVKRSYTSHVANSISVNIPCLYDRHFNKGSETGPWTSCAAEHLLRGTKYTRIWT